MTTIYPGKDPLAPLKFMATATRLTFTIRFLEGGWQGTRYQLLQVFNERLDGMYDLLLGDESKLTDEEAQYVVYVEPEEVLKAQAVIDYMVGGTSG